MPICKPSHRRCVLGEIDQDPGEFLTDFKTPTGKHITRKTRLCRACREEHRKYKNPEGRRKGIGVGSRGSPVRPARTLTPGNDPPMSNDQRAMWQRWLLGLITEDGAPKFPAARKELEGMSGN